MANLGNTGQRYKLRKRISAEHYQDWGVLITLECGHTYVARPWQEGAVEILLDSSRKRIGKRERCNDCS